MIKAVYKRNRAKQGSELVAAILCAIDAAKTCRSTMTVDLLEMALLNEGTRLAAELARKKAAPAARRTSSLSRRPTLVGAKQITAGEPPGSESRSARSEVAQFARLPATDRESYGV